MDLNGPGLDAGADRELTELRELIDLFTKEARYVREAIPDQYAHLSGLSRALREGLTSTTLSPWFILAVAVDMRAQEPDPAPFTIGGLT